MQGLAGAEEDELIALREQQEAHAEEFEDLLSCLGQETAKVRSTDMPEHYESWTYCQSTSRVQA